MKVEELKRRMQGLKEYELKVHPSDEWADRTWEKLGVKTSDRARIIAQNYWAHGYACAVEQMCRLADIEEGEKG